MVKRSLRDLIIEDCLRPEYDTSDFLDVMKMLVFDRGIPVIMNMIEIREKLEADKKKILGDFVDG